ncbi:uncharacterized protein LOC126844134 [Adelges cooleyi]|uniref:uncharacterized protein LOC126844134 n=1 Tax=Adelges cooleyi TaxID=133065 RepID=UPI00218011BC|nr:uncharacterized protein LOC126844134 [Adelges cooleyi]
MNSYVYHLSIVFVIFHLQCIKTLIVKNDAPLLNISCLNLSEQCAQKALSYANKINDEKDSKTKWKYLMKFVGDKVKKRSLEYYKRSQRWSFGGTWTSECAGVRFDVDSQSTVGIDNNMPVKLVEKSGGKCAGGFLDRNWLAKASGPSWSEGPITLYAINQSTKMFAAFIGYPQKHNNKEFIMGMWTMGRWSVDNSGMHQSVYTIPDVLHRDCF